VLKRVFVSLPLAICIKFLTDSHFIAIFLYLISREESLKYAREKKRDTRTKKRGRETPTSYNEREREREREREKERDALLFADRAPFGDAGFFTHTRARERLEKSWGN
jgi:hypothetical protein